MRNLILDYKPGFAFIPGTGPWKINDAETGETITSSTNPENAINKAKEITKSCLCIDYTDAALDRMHKIAEFMS